MHRSRRTGPTIASSSLSRTDTQYGCKHATFLRDAGFSAIDRTHDRNLIRAGCHGPVFQLSAHATASGDRHHRSPTSSPASRSNILCIARQRSWAILLAFFTCPSMALGRRRLARGIRMTDRAPGGFVDDAEFGDRINAGGTLLKRGTLCRPPVALKTGSDEKSSYTPLHQFLFSRRAYPQAASSTAFRTGKLTTLASLWSA